MKYPISWLKEFVTIETTPQELADTLSLAGLEVEGISYIGKDLDNVKTCKIESIKKHPNADKLSVTQVFDGKETHQIVCGAKNIFEGAIVPVSFPGAKLPNGLTIKKSEIRGEASNGMICSEVELGADNVSDGIWLLDPKTPVGIDFVKYACLSDAILDISILPNRGDSLSILGLAREIATLYNTELKQPNLKGFKETDIEDITLHNLAFELCPLYTARRITHIKQNKTPLWMQRRLQLCDIRPISLSVDITNYVLLEMGQPLHAFDHNKLNYPIEIRRSKENESILTLDNEKRKLPQDALVISDAKHAQAVAGIMGGKLSEVDEKTTDILLEAAYFNPINTRRTGQKLTLRSESSQRFEKGVDIQNVENASLRACVLFSELANAKISKNLIKSENIKDSLFQKKTIPFHSEKINSFLGTTYTEEAMLSTLESLGFNYSKQKKEIHIPSFRAQDIQEMACLAEEIARIKGFDSIPSILPRSMVAVEKETHLRKTEKQVTDHFINLGFTQINTFPFVSENAGTLTLQAENKSDTLFLANPISKEEAVMRSSLLHSMLKVAMFNTKRQMPNLSLFEIDKTFYVKENEPAERKELLALICGDVIENNYKNGNKESSSFGFSQLKHLAEKVISPLRLNITFKASETQHLHPVKALDIYVRKDLIGRIGVLHPSVAKNYDLSGDIFIIELTLDTIVQCFPDKQNYKPIAKFPSTRRDIAMLVPKTLKYSKIEDQVKKLKPKLVTDFFLFDLFESEKIGPENKSLAMGFIYQDSNKTLSDDEVNTAHAQFSEKLIQSLDISIR